jgi:hypothetical protein
VYAVGDAGTVIRFADGAWQRDSVPSTADLRAVWVEESGRAYVAGHNGTVLFFDGAWHVHSASGDRVAAIASCGGTLYAAGGRGWLAAERNGRWERVPAPTTAFFETLACEDERTLWVGGARGTLLAYEATRDLPAEYAWTRELQPTSAHAGRARSAPHDDLKSVSLEQREGPAGFGAREVEVLREVRGEQAASLW